MKKVVYFYWWSVKQYFRLVVERQSNLIILYQNIWILWILLTGPLTAVFLKCFILRFLSQHRVMLEAFQSVFGLEFWHHVILVVLARREESATARGGIHNSWLAKLREKLPAASAAPLHQVTICTVEGKRAPPLLEGVFTIPGSPSSERNCRPLARLRYTRWLYVEGKRAPPLLEGYSQFLAC